MRLLFVFLAIYVSTIVNSEAQEVEGIVPAFVASFAPTPSTDSNVSKYFNY